MTDTRPATRVIELPTQWLREHMHDALTIYGLAMGYDSGVVAGRYGYAVQHTERPGFRAVGAFALTSLVEEDGRIPGLVTSHLAHVGDIVPADAVDPANREYLTRSSHRQKSASRGRYHTGTCVH